MIEVYAEPLDPAGQPPASYTLRAYRGDDRGWRFRFWADPDRTQPIDLTGATVAAQVRHEPDARAAVDLACYVEDPHTVWMGVDSATSARLPLTGVWDMRVVYPGGKVGTIIAGPVEVTPGITRGDRPSALPGATLSGPAPTPRS